MLGLLFAINLISCESDSLIQTLVFGKDSSNRESEYFCDCNFSPYRSLSSVTIFKVINQDQDQAVPCARIFAYASPSSGGYSRINIPESLAIKDISYSFQFEFNDGPNAFSESWEYDVSKSQFGLASSIQKNWWENTKVQVGAGLVGLLALCGTGSYLYRRSKKTRSLYVQ